LWILYIKKDTEGEKSPNCKNEPTKEKRLGLIKTTAVQEMLYLNLPKTKRQKTKKPLSFLKGFRSSAPWRRLEPMSTAADKSPTSNI